MQVTVNQVVVHVAPASRLGDGGPVFSVSTVPVPSGEANLVQVSAAARAMAEVAATGTRPQLALFLQRFGSFSSVAAHSFVPFAPAAVAAERFAPPADAASEARMQAADDAVQRDQRQHAAQELAAARQQGAAAQVAAYREVGASGAADSSAPAAAPQVDTSA